MSQQTAVELLIKELIKEGYYIPKYISEQAKQMEKEQIIAAHNDGKNVLPPNENGDQYYIEKYGNKEML